MYSNVLYSQKRDWALFNNSAGTIGVNDFIFRGTYTKPDVKNPNIYSKTINPNATLTGFNTYNNDNGTEVVSLVSTTWGTDIYIKSQLLTTVSGFDDEVGIIPIPSNPDVSNLIIGDKIYKLDISTSTLSNPIDLIYQLPTFPPSAAVNFYSYEGGFCSSAPDPNSGTYKVYTVQCNYCLPSQGYNTSAYYNLIETIIDYNNFTISSDNIVKTFEIGTLTFANGVTTGFSNKTYSEMEYLSGRVAWGENSNIHTMDLATSTYKKYNASYRITGLEFNPRDPKELWISYTNIGLAKWDVVNSNSPTNMSYTSDYCYSQIEAGANGDMYMMSLSSGNLRGYTTQIFSYNTQQQYTNVVNNMATLGFASMGGCYSLPEQIDGWDYKIITSQSVTSATITQVPLLCNDFTLTVSPANVSGFKCYYDADCKLLAGAFIGRNGTVTAYRSFPSIWVKYMDYDNNSEGTNKIKIDLINTSSTFDIEAHYNISSYSATSNDESWDCLGNTVTYDNRTNYYLNNNTANHPQSATYLWDLGNDKTSTAFNPQANTYSLPGAFDITLIATDNYGCKDISIKKLHIDKNTLKQLPDMCSNDNIDFEERKIGTPLGGSYYIDYVPVTNNYTIADALSNQNYNPHILQYDVCGTTTSTTFNINQAPAAANFTSPTGSPVDLCWGTSVTLTNTANDARWFSISNLSPLQVHSTLNGHTTNNFTNLPNTQYHP